MYFCPIKRKPKSKVNLVSMSLPKQFLKEVRHPSNHQKNQDTLIKRLVSGPGQTDRGRNKERKEKGREGKKIGGEGSI